MKDSFLQWLQSLGLENSEQAYFLTALSVILVTSLVLHLLLHHVVLRFFAMRAKTAEQAWRKAILGKNLFTRIALALQGVVLVLQAKIWLNTESDLLPFIKIFTSIWILIYALLALFSLLDALEDIAQSSKAGRRLPLRGIFQCIKLVGSIIVGIICIALLIGKSPVILFSGLGAMTAVTLLVFRDPLLGLVAGIQLSANRMLAVGDWLEMPKYGADGDVIEISLTTVKVQNWDKTITTIPAYSLISESFKNWRGMSEAGGRRIKRAVNIDATSVHFLSEDDIQRLRKAKLLTSYIENKVAEIDAYNKEHCGASDSQVNARKLTNLGTFRAYLNAYLKAHKDIHKYMTQMVRQLEPTSTGIPLEIYAFSSNINWVEYEGIQSDLFDHIFSVLPEFGLRIFQSPTGYDMQQLGGNLQAQRAPVPRIKARSRAPAEAAPEGATPPQENQEPDK